MFLVILHKRRKRKVRAAPIAPTTGQFNNPTYENSEDPPEMQAKDNDPRVPTCGARDGLEEPPSKKAGPWRDPKRKDYLPLDMLEGDLPDETNDYMEAPAGQNLSFTNQLYNSNGWTFDFYCLQLVLCKRTTVFL